MHFATYEDALRVAQQLTPEEQDRLIDALKAMNKSADETVERREQGSTGAPLNEPQPYNSPRTSSE